MSGRQKHDTTGLRVTTREEGSVVRLVDVEVDAARVNRAAERAYRDLSREVRVRGFRPGKVPRSVLERLYGPSLAEQLQQALVAETLPAALEEVGVAPVAEPTVEATPPTVGESYRYTARIEVKPALTLPDLAGLPASRPRVEVGDEDIDAELEGLRQRTAPLLEEPEGTALAEGHVAVIDFVGRIDGKPFEGGSGQGVESEIGSGQFLADFESQLLGANAGDDREVSIRFPDDYGSEELAGKQAVFAVHVAAVKRRRVAELDDEFAKDLGDFDSLAALRQRIADDLRSARERNSRAELRRTLMDALIDRTSFEVPAGLVERQLQSQLQAAHRRLEGQLSEDALHEQLSRWREEWRGRAERDVRETLLLEAVASSESIVADAEAVATRIGEMAKERGVSTKRLREGLGEALEGALSAQLIEEKALDFLVSQAKVDETAAS